MKKVLTLVALGLLSIACSAGAAVWCTGTVNNVYVGANGDLIARMSFRGDYLKMCNLNQHPTVSQLTCSHWAAYLNTAVANNQTMILQYEEDTACDVLPTYGYAPTPVYLMLCDGVDGVC